MHFAFFCLIRCWCYMILPSTWLPQGLDPTRRLLPHSPKAAWPMSSNVSRPPGHRHGACRRRRKLGAVSLLYVQCADRPAGWKCVLLVGEIIRLYHWDNSNYKTSSFLPSPQLIELDVFWERPRFELAGCFDLHFLISGWCFRVRHRLGGVKLCLGVSLRALEIAHNKKHVLEITVS